MRSTCYFDTCAKIARTINMLLTRSNNMRFIVRFTHAINMLFWHMLCVRKSHVQLTCYSQHVILHVVCVQKIARAIIMFFARSNNMQFFRAIRSCDQHVIFRVVIACPKIAHAINMFFARSNNMRFFRKGIYITYTPCTHTNTHTNPYTLRHTLTHTQTYTHTYRGKHVFHSK